MVQRGLLIGQTPKLALRAALFVHHAPVGGTRGRLDRATRAAGGTQRADDERGLVVGWFGDCPTPGRKDHLAAAWRDGHPLRPDESFVMVGDDAA
jgi:hypothetical protein